MREGDNISALCRGFGVGRTTGYRWIRRCKAESKEGLSDRSRRPRSSPNETSGRVEEAVCAAEDNIPAGADGKPARDSDAKRMLVSFPSVRRRPSRYVPSVQGVWGRRMGRLPAVLWPVRASQQKYRPRPAEPWEICF